jgi:DNA-binding beta-propeller fold protein YncE
VNAFLADAGITGSTEDLEFTPDGQQLLLGAPGVLIALDPAGNAQFLPISGVPLVNPLGIAFDREGNLWIADSGASALLKMSPSGEVVTALTSDGTQDLVGPNYVAVGPDGRIYLSDPCIGELIRFDPKRGVVDAVLSFDLPTEGGPNGFAFDPTGKRLWLATENTGLLCGHSFVGITDPIASLFAIDVDDAGFGNVETVVDDFALFGDGAAFDVEGNLYVIFDTQKDFMLEESAIWVLPAGAAQLEKLASVRGRVLANLAFAPPAFGSGELYIALLAVPPFTPATARGAERLPVGIAGLPLLP